MTKYEYLTPEGVRDYIDLDMQKKEYISNTLKDLYQSFGYSLIETPSFEYLDVFSDSKIQNPGLYTFINRNNELLALRADMTKSLARVIAKKPSKRLCYSTNIYRYPKEYQGRLHEFSQAGIELMDIDSIKADVEAIRLAIMSMERLGIDNFSIHIGSTRFIETILSLTNNKNDVLEAINNNDGVTLNEMLLKSVSKDLSNIILELSSRVGKIDLLERIIEKFPDNKDLLRLKEIYYMLIDYSKYISFDFSLLSYGTYYDGITFKGFVKGVGDAVLSGGRYVELVKDKNISSVGFGIEINSLISKVKYENNKKHALIGYKNNASKAYLKANELINNGYIVRMSSANNIEELKECIELEDYVIFVDEEIEVL